MSLPSRAAAVAYHRELVELALAEEPAAVESVLGDLYDEGALAGEEVGERKSNGFLTKKLEQATERLRMAERQVVGYRKKAEELQLALKKLRVEYEAILRSADSMPREGAA